MLDIIGQGSADLIKKLVNLLEILTVFWLFHDRGKRRSFRQDDGGHCLCTKQLAHFLIDEVFGFDAELKLVLGSSEHFKALFNFLTLGVITLEQQLVDDLAFGRLFVCVRFVLKESLKYFVVHVAVDCKQNCGVVVNFEVDVDVRIF